MPYTKFQCPDGIEVGIDECLLGCRLQGITKPDGELWCPGGRCLSKQVLRAVADQRIWKGKPSTTQLLNGTRENYLRIVNDYSINPRNSMFMLHGTRVHNNLEQYTEGDELAEIRLEDDYSTGAFDYYDPENGGTLYDSKTYGSFKVTHVLGLREVQIPTGEFYKNGNPKVKKKYVPGGCHHRFDLAVQLNDYRMKIEKKLHLPVEHMLCQVIVRDGNTYIAASRGITEPSYLVPINRISDKWIERFMKAKSTALIDAVKSGICPPPCNARERWNGRKCQNYCDVNKFCDYYNKELQR